MLALDDWTDRVVGPHGTPERREYERRLSILHRRAWYFEAVTRWMRRIPLVGRVVYFWWYAYLDEGLDGAVDMLCFHFLDDVNPTTRWHKW
jgi:hypothetical protein